MRRGIFGLTLLLGLGAATAGDWPRFGGPNGSGVADGPVPLKWSGTEGYAWKVPLPGSGNGSPVVADGKVYLQAAGTDGSGRTLLCLDAATGATVWKAEKAGVKAHVHSKNSLASSTPCIDGGRVYAVFWDGRVVSVAAYDLAGHPLWETPLGGYESQHGVGFSPVAHAGRVFVNYDQDGEAVFVALDAKTGDKLWATPRKPFRACYSSPLVREVGGATEVIDVSSAGATAYDPATGAIRWNWDWPFDGMVLRTVASPLLAGDVLVLVSGDGGGSRSMVVLDIATKSPKKLWEKRRDTPYVPGVVALGDHLYWVTDAGVATCAETRTGKIVWSERAFNKPVSASPVLAGDTVLTIAEDGKAIAFKATPAGFEKLASNALGEAVFGTPAASNGRLIVRGATHLFAFGPK